MTRRARYFTRLDDTHLRCDLCPRHCRLKEGQRGFCFVRKMSGGDMVLTTYGKSTGFCIDPIEKKPLNHFLPSTPVLSFGTAGCNLGCRFCQNWTISKSRQTERLSDQATPEEIAAAAKRTGCRSVAYTYNDPVIWAEYAIDTAKACHEVGVKNVAVTAGYITKTAREDFFRHIDAANVDLKALSQRFYKKLCFANLEPVLDTLMWLKRETDVWIEVTTLVIPGQNDSEEQVSRLSAWLVENLGADVPLHLSAFRPDYKMRSTPRTSIETLRTAREIARSHGIHHVFTGNVHDLEGDATFCPKCGELLIQRDWYNLLQWHLESGACRKCGTEIAGVFEDEPGTWGAKRAVVQI